MGQKRAFVVDGETVAREVSAYAAFLADEVARMGREHPMVKTQYFCEEIDAQASLFDPARLSRMCPAQVDALPQRYATALLVDVGGEAWGADASAAPDERRDATAATLVAVLPGQAAGRALPCYRPLLRRSWVGASQTLLFEELLALAHAHAARRVVIDATGVGAGLASFLARALPQRVIPFLFNSASKSKLGWDFLALVDGGRWQEPPHAPPELRTAEFLRQLRFCRAEALPGAGRLLRWGVPDGLRDPRDGKPVHDDWVLSAALAAVLDGIPWGSAADGAQVIPAPDPLGRQAGY